MYMRLRGQPDNLLAGPGGAIGYGVRRRSGVYRAQNNVCSVSFLKTELSR